MWNAVKEMWKRLKSGANSPGRTGYNQKKEGLEHTHTAVGINTRNKRVLVIINSTKFSGAESSIMTLLEHLRNEYQIFVALPADSDLDDRFKKIGYNTIALDMMRFSGSKTILQKMKQGFHIVKQGFKIAKMVRSKQIDVVWANSTQALIYVLFLKFFKHVQLIWHVRDNLPKKYIPYLLGFFATKIICISEHVRRQVPKLFRAAVVYNGVDVTIWKPELNKKVPPQLRLPDSDTFLVGNIGQLIPWKNHRDFIKCAAIVSRSISTVHFFIIGADLFSAYDEYVEDLQEQIEQAGLAHKITFVDHQEHIAPMINSLDIIVHTALGEPLGRVILEAMALGKPVVSYSTGGIKEIITHGTDGFLVAEQDVEGIAHAVIELLRNEERYRQTIGLNARNKINSQFNIQKIAEQIKELL
ncbi:glycosyl transferase family 1 [Sphingobacterium faecium NBRC 15299]|nr:glycosyl transferase family 1 [Sphingobacterium faecium NBRC 15299]